MKTTAPTLTTERLSIEPISLDHWEDYAAAWADPRMTAFIGGEPRSRNVSWGKMLQGIGMWPLLGYGYWSFVERASGRFVGNGGLAQFERGIEELEGFPEAGWAFIPDAWGKGYATEAMTAILLWADGQGLGEIRCIIEPGNTASRNVAGKLGFTKCAESHDVMGDMFIYRREPRLLR
ncbi:GNAT family N-acetyltransferase [Sphingorhabdus sp.]|jgi:RimJ/RimL family protein N-acetyltransferase|uniref:GNAT family N-acetyltransferase n=2 Tax=Sphingorhabdus sp. TaxID=1902408 RepID=UPI0037C8F9B7